MWSLGLSSHNFTCHSAKTLNSSSFTSSLLSRLFLQVLSPAASSSLWCFSIPLIVHEVQAVATTCLHVSPLAKGLGQGRALISLIRASSQGSLHGNKSWWVDGILIGNKEKSESPKSCNICSSQCEAWLERYCWGEGKPTSSWKPCGLIFSAEQHSECRQLKRMVDGALHMISVQASYFHLQWNAWADRLYNPLLLSVLHLTTLSCLLNILHVARPGEGQTSDI